MNSLRQLLPVGAVLLALVQSGFAQGSAFTYQGRLSAGATPANGQYEMTFTLYNALTNGAVVGTGQTIAPIAVTNGLFTTQLDFGAAAFDGSARWLEITVNLFGSDMIPTILVPRQPITPAPYAIHAANAAGLMTANNNPLDIKVNGQRALRLEPTSLWDPQIAGAPNVIGGSSANGVSFEATGATIGGGGAVAFNGTDGRNSIESSFATIGGGMSNSISTQAGGAIIGGGMMNTIRSEGVHSTISGGSLNIIQEDAGTATISGGRENNVTGDAGTISGGWGNTAAGYGTVGGGYVNRAGSHATIGGGAGNEGIGDYATVGGGQENKASGNHATVAGGTRNSIATGAYDSFIGGGVNNTNLGYESVIGGGSWNLVTELRATIGGGAFNHASGHVATIAGGFQNRASGYVSTVAGGYGNFATGYYGSVGGGQANVSDNTASTVAGGDSNHAQAHYSAIGGGHGNAASGYASVIAGGGGRDESGEDSIGNSATGDWSSVGGGSLNYAFGAHSVIGGGDRNVVETNASFATIGGGEGNRIAAEADASVIAGGSLNSVGTNANSNFIGGGGLNRIDDASSSAIVGGFDNHLGSYASVISGGRENGILENSEFSSISGGENNHIADNSPNSTIGGGDGNQVLANSSHAMIPGGLGNVATNLAFAAGQRAYAIHQGAFLWADSTGPRFVSVATNEFAVRATGGVRFVSAIDADGTPIAGVALAPGSGTWSSLSDRNAKENLRTADPRAILEKVAALPLATWNYKSQDKSIRHLGPMAQDFHAAFGVGENDRTITTVDADGVALAAIQGLNQKVEEENRALRAALSGRDTEIAELKTQSSHSVGKSNLNPRWSEGKRSGLSE